MATARKLTAARALPTRVKIEPQGSLTPNEMRALKEHTGRPLNDLLGGDAEDMDAAPDRIQSLVYIQLRREGFEATWEEAGDVLPDYTPEAPDPTPTGLSDSSSTSAGSGA